MSDNMNHPSDEIMKKMSKTLKEANEETAKKITGQLLNIIEKYSLKQEEGKIFNDSIHGHVELHPLLVKIIDTPQFQRLRNIKQLGGVYWVYPGASHNRFEHSIGVAYLAGCLVSSLQENQPELNITNRDKLCVQIAGLSRDLGHGPLSKMFEKLFIPEVLKVPEGSKKHSELTVEMFHHMIKENGLKTVMERYGMKPDEDCRTIENMIRGSSETAGEKNFLYEITENKLNGVDVNKFDYFKRDCHHLGLSNSFDHQRLMKFARVCEVDGKNHICFSLKEADNIYEMFRTHYNLHRQAYQHKTVSIIEILIKNAFIEANEHLKISAAIGDIKKYSKLTDKIFEDILYSTNDELKNAREILQDVVKRRLPKCVGEGRLPEIRDEKDKQALQNQLEGNWKTAVKKWNREKKTNLNSDDFIVDVIEMDHGMKEKNSFDSISFYSKSNPDHAFKIRNYQVSSFMPKHFDEKHVRVYYNKILEGGVDGKILTSAKQCFVQWGNNRFGLPGCITLYEKENFQGKSHTLDRECPTLKTKSFLSYRVHSGTWIFYCEDKIKDVNHIVKQGDSGNLNLWTSTEESTKTWSCKMHSCVIALFEENSGWEVITDSSPSSIFTSERKVLSYQWFSGIWTCESSEKKYLLSEAGHCEWSSETIIQVEFQAEWIVISYDEEYGL